MSTQDRGVPIFIEDLQKSYKKSREIYQGWHYGTQIAVIVLSGLSPIILLFPNNGELAKFFAGLTAASASAIAGASNILNLREKYGLNKVNSEKINLEIAKYQEKVLAYKVDDDKAEDKLFEEVSKLHLDRLEKWQHRFIEENNDEIKPDKK